MKPIQLTGQKELELFEMLESALKSLVDQPDDVDIVPIIRSTSLVFQIRVSPATMNKIAGKNERVIRALRLIMRANSVGLNRHIAVEIVQTGTEQKSSFAGY